MNGISVNGFFGNRVAVWERMTLGMLVVDWKVNCLGIDLITLEYFT